MTVASFPGVGAENVCMGGITQCQASGDIYDATSGPWLTLSLHLESPPTHPTCSCPHMQTQLTIQGFVKMFFTPPPLNYLNFLFVPLLSHSLLSTLHQLFL